ncbi:hypothetical protein NKG94_03945 [Micromonospora sp. M12]
MTDTSGLPVAVIDRLVTRALRATGPSERGARCTAWNGAAAPTSSGDRPPVRVHRVDDVREALEIAQREPAARLAFVTRDALAVRAGDTVGGLDASPVWAAACRAGRAAGPLRDRRHRCRDRPRSTRPAALDDRRGSARDPGRCRPRTPPDPRARRRVWFVAVGSGRHRPGHRWSRRAR